MALCLVCEREAVFGAGWYCLRCWDASENFRANTFDGSGSYRAYLESLMP